MSRRASQRRAGRDQAGFTMVEIMVCLSILAIAILGIMAATVTSQRSAVFTRSSKRAALLLNDLLERYRSAGSSGVAAAIDTDPVIIGEYVVADFVPLWNTKPTNPAAAIDDPDGDTYPVTNWPRCFFRIASGIGPGDDGVLGSGGDDETFPTELNDATVEVSILPESLVLKYMPSDLDGDGDVDNDDTPHLDNDTSTSLFNQYTVVPIRIALTYRTGLTGSDGVPETRRITACTVIYPSSISD